eukprot:364877-Chlamydomonas_euryale.AAC.8
MPFRDLGGRLCGQDAIQGPGRQVMRARCRSGTWAAGEPGEMLFKDLAYNAGAGAVCCACVGCCAEDTPVTVRKKQEEGEGRLSFPGKLSDPLFLSVSARLHTERA